MHIPCAPGGAPVRVSRAGFFASTAAFSMLMIFGLAPRAATAQSSDALVEHDVPAKMRDGVVLKADVYRPKADGKYPVLLQRTPYDKSYTRNFGMRAAAHGYVVAVQDVRGRFASDGEWYPFRHESEDGYDT